MKLHLEENRWWFALPFILLLTLTLSAIDVTPIWDGMWNFSLIINEYRRQPLSDVFFKEFTHPPLYLFLGSLPAMLLDGSHRALNLTNICWMLFSVWGFLRVVDHLTTPILTRMEKTLFACVAATCPLIISTIFHFSTDTGIAVFYPWVLDGFLRRRGLQTVIAGTCLIFSRETGIVLYGVTWMCVLAFSWKEFFSAERSKSLKHHLLLFIPVTFAGLYLLWRHLHGFILLHDEGNLNFGYSPEKFAALKLIFITNFTWLLWFVPFTAYAIRRTRLTRSELTVAAILALATFAITTKFPFLNPRYFVVLQIPLILLSGILLVRSIPSAAFRQVFLLLIIELNCFSNFYSFDPVSLWLFGANQYGNMTVYCNYDNVAWGCNGRDQIVYNQQFLEVSKAQNILFQTIQPASGSVFITSNLAGFFVHTPLDQQVYTKTLRSNGAVYPWYLSSRDALALKSLPKRVSILRYALMESDADLEKFRALYKTTSFKKYGTSRYQVAVEEMELKETL